MPCKTKLFFISLFLLSSCAGQRLASTEERDPAGAGAATSAPVVAPDSPAGINKIIDESNSVLSENPDHANVHLQIPIEINLRVQKWIKYFTVRQKEMTTRYLERGEPLRAHIEAILKDSEVPIDLYYLAMIESGFVTAAKSKAKAVGIWQFVKGTGRNYRMEVNDSVDERRNWIKATEAAANYLKDLNNVFGNWYLALAAYNSGEHKIVRSIMKGKTRDFWVLAERGLLPQETMDYVPKFLAAKIVGRNFKSFGINPNIGPEDAWEAWDTVSVPAGSKLKDLANLTGVSLDVLKRWNRDLLKGITPFSKTGFVEIYMPKTEVAKFDAVKEKIAQMKIQRSPKERKRLAEYAAEADHSYDFYVVKRGDNLGRIAKHIGISARTLMKINGLQRGRIHPGQRLKFYSNKPNTLTEKNSDRKRGPAGIGE